MTAPTLSPFDGEFEQIKDRYQKIISVLAAHRIALWEYDIPTGKCSFAADYFRTLGLEEAGIVFSDLEGFYPFVLSEDADRYREEFAHMLESETKTTNIKVRCRGKNGEIIWLEDHFFSYKDDGSGKPQTLIAYTINVTEASEKEAQIRRLEDRNRKVIESLPEFIFIFDERFYIHDVLMSKDTVLLHTLDELIGSDAHQIYSPEVSDLFLRNIRECLRDGEIHEIEYPLDKDGVRYYFQARIAPFEGDKVIALIRDNGERVEHTRELIEARQRAIEADRMKSVFLATMSHEIRTPLSAIVGFSEIIANGESPEEREEFLQIIRKNSSLLLQLIDDILDLSRIESGKSAMSFQWVEVTSLLNEAEKIHQLRMKPGVRLQASWPNEETWINSDRNRISQVIFNFLSNAIKHTQKGKITLGMKPGGDWLELFVTDTGSGIPAEKLPLIFNRFEKLNDFVQGTGLGLSICKSIAERLGGEITVESEQGRGSTFTLRLPYRKDDTPTAHLPLTPETGNEVQDSPRIRKTILVAEDVDANYQLIKALLKNDYVLLRAMNGEEAVGRFIRERPDLILMDIKMPVMNGIAATEKIRTVSASVPIIAVTAHAFYTEREQALAAGCNAIISKPFSASDLRETVARYI